MLVLESGGAHDLAYVLQQPEHRVVLFRQDREDRDVHRRASGLKRPGPGQRAFPRRGEQLVQLGDHPGHLRLTWLASQVLSLIWHLETFVMTVEQARNDCDPALLGEVDRGLVLSPAKIRFASTNH